MISLARVRAGKTWKYNSYVVDADGVILRAWRQATPLAAQMIGARPKDIIISRWARVNLLDTIAMVLRDGQERALKVYIRTPEGRIRHRRLIIHPLIGDRAELIISAHPVKPAPPLTKK